MMTAEPQLFVADIAAAAAFYVERLGFEVAFMHGEPPFYAQVRRDGARLNLRHADQPVFHDAFRANNPDALSATVTTLDAAALFQECQDAGATIHQTLRTEPWGARIFIIRDPDGNLIAFAGG
jgi:uncharacterized glyoxalase superfamily protein PhnB